MEALVVICSAKEHTCEQCTAFARYSHTHVRVTFKRLERERNCNIRWQKVRSWVVKTTHAQMDRVMVKLSKVSTAEDDEGGKGKQLLGGYNIVYRCECERDDWRNRCRGWHGGPIFLSLTLPSPHWAQSRSMIELKYSLGGFPLFSALCSSLALIRMVVATIFMLLPKCR